MCLIQNDASKNSFKLYDTTTVLFCLGQCHPLESRRSPLQGEPFGDILFSQ